MAFEDLLGALDKLEIKFLVGGSVASGTHAFPRPTQDIDVIADIGTDRIDSFCEALAPNFYVDAITARQSVTTGRAFNIIHSRYAFKFDIFPVGNSAFIQAEIGRALCVRSRVQGPEGIEFPVASPEGIILGKLDWYRGGAETSERQWNDILDVIQVCRASLDLAYLDHWATELRVADLLAVALAQPHRQR
ncbi:MAG: hypothetical protein ABI823_04865 [Bryobacteraceae bacterium]